MLKVQTCLLRKEPKSLSGSQEPKSLSGSQVLPSDFCFSTAFWLERLAYLFPETKTKSPKVGAEKDCHFETGTWTSSAYFVMSAGRVEEDIAPLETSRDGGAAMV